MTPLFLVGMTTGNFVGVTRRSRLVDGELSYRIGCWRVWRGGASVPYYMTSLRLGYSSTTAPSIKRNI